MTAMSTTTLHYIHDAVRLVLRRSAAGAQPARCFPCGPTAAA